jgi:hypothetical protein
MKKTYFEALKIEAELNDNQYYYDLGAFSNRKKISERIGEIIGGHVRNLEWENGQGGFCCTVPVGDEQYAFTTYKPRRGVSPWMLRGHEETHALHRFGKLSPLLEGFTNLGIEVQPEKMDKEILAALGGLYAMLHRGQYIRIFDAQNCEPELLEAERIFREGITRGLSK